MGRKRKTGYRWDFLEFILKKYAENPNIKKSQLPEMYRKETGGKIRDSVARKMYREFFESVPKSRKPDAVERRRIAYEFFAKKMIQNDPKISGRKIRERFRKETGLSISNSTANEIVRQVRGHGKSYEKITRLKYISMKERGRRYDSQYAYIVTYWYRRPDSFIWEKGAVTVLSDEQMQPTDVIGRAIELLAEDVFGHYAPYEIDFGSLTIEQALYR